MENFSERIDDELGWSLGYCSRIVYKKWRLSVYYFDLVPFYNLQNLFYLSNKNCSHYWFSSGRKSYTKIDTDQNTVEVR